MTAIVNDAVVNGARLHFETHGDPSAPGVVVLHGGPGVGDSREHPRDYGALGDEFRLLFYDARGCGRSEDRPPYTHEQWVADLDELTRYVGMERFSLIGHSYGGMVAQEYAIGHQNRLDRLVLVDTAPTSVDHDEPIRRALDTGLPGMEEGWLRKLFEGRLDSDAEFRDVWERLLPLYFEGAFDPTLPRQLADGALLHFETHNFAFSVNNPRFDVRSRLGDLRVPTLVVCGDNDWITPLALSEDIARRIPGSRLEVFEHSGHRPMIDHPAKFISVLRGFLGGE
jgi:proline iminopeptidase